MSSNKYTNKLSLETSPYLLQHAHNPIDWYPWGDEALQKAQRENKLLIISIGYAACHWCHVMEHESFENEEVAQFMNENFVAIKVDREERPDIDQIYMNAVNLLTGSGGWPLNCITLPDGRPIWGGTYFPKHQWISMLKKVLLFVKNSPEKAEEQAVQITKGVNAPEFHFTIQESTECTNSIQTSLVENWKYDIDYVKGGTKGAPKFPLPVGYSFLLEHYFHTKDEEAMKAVEITLDKMGDGGIYDHIGGGFARYSTDEDWLVPHFEKMLYDNGQLVSLYSKMYQLTKKDRYKEIVSETIAFVLRELSSPSGGFYSSLDADSEGVEGKFYVWQKDEIQEFLTEKAAIFNKFYSVTDKGNWEGSNILTRTKELKVFAQEEKIKPTDLTLLLNQCKKTLLRERDKRVRPALDDKVLTSWNTLMLKGLVDAYNVFGEKMYLERAIEGANFIKNTMTKEDGSLYRNYKNGKCSINAFLEDYAFTIDFYLSLYESTFNEDWLTEALTLITYTNSHFSDSDSPMFYFTSDKDSALIARKIEVTDNVLSSGNSQMAKNLFKLGTILYNEDLKERSKEMTKALINKLPRTKAYLSNWASNCNYLTYPLYTVAITGGNALSVRRKFGTLFYPNVVFTGGYEKGSLQLHNEREFSSEATIYVCKEGICKAPSKSFEGAIKGIS